MRQIIKYSLTPKLWVPSHYLTSKYLSQLKKRGFLDFISVTVGYRTIYNKEALWDDLIERLKKYSLEQILTIVSMINGLLFNQENLSNLTTQQEICNMLFGKNKSQVLYNFYKYQRENNEQFPTVLFYEAQLLNLLKIALLIDLPKTSNISEDSLIPLGEALLMVTDLVFEAIDISKMDVLQRWLQFVVPNTFFSQRDIDLHSLARCYELYLRDKPHLKTHSSYCPLPLWVEKITGLKPEILWSVIFALTGHWFKSSRDFIERLSKPLDFYAYFTRNFEFTNEEIEKFFNLVGIEVDKLREEIKKTYKINNIRPFHILPFAKYPLIKLDKMVYCISIRHLILKLTTGLHYIFLNGLPSKERNKYLTYMGVVFEDYVKRLFYRVYPQSANRYFSLDKVKCNINGKFCDGIVLYENAVILLEIKATLFPLSARTGEDMNEIQKKFNEIFIKAAEQIDNTIKAIESDKLKISGIKPTMYYPVIITLEDVPINPIIYSKISEDLKSKGILLHPKIKPLQIIGVRELEHLEILIEKGFSFKEIIDDKISSNLTKNESFSYYFYIRNDKFPAVHNLYLKKIFDEELSKKAITYFKSREK